MRFPAPRALGASLPLCAASLAVWLSWTWFEGGHSDTALAPGGVVLLALLVLSLALRGPGLLATSRTRAGMAACLAAFAAWNALSIAWADFPGDAWAGADKAGVYVAGFLLLALWPIPPRLLDLLLGAFALGVGLTAAVVFLRAVGAADPAAAFYDDRLVSPTGYVNANVALWMCALWPAVHLGSRRDVPAALRAAFLATGALLVDVAVLGESRAWLALMPLAAGLFVLLQAQRLRALLGLAVVGGAAAVALRPLLDVYERAADGASLGPPLDTAAPFVAAAALVAAAAGVVWAAVDARVVPSPRAMRIAGVAVVAGAVVVAAVAAVAAARDVDSPRAWVSEKWDEFRCPYCPGSSGGSRLTGTLSNDRYRMWTIAWDAFEEHPVRGIGADNYAAEYLLRRTDPYFQPRYPHSLPLRLLSQLGVVGTALLVVPLALAVALALRARRRLPPPQAGAVGAAVAIFGYWALHGSVDWFWELPALAAPALAFLGAASAVEPEAGAGTPTGRARSWVPWVAAVLAVALAASLAARWLADSLEAAAARTWVAQPDLAYRRLDTAARLDPLSAEPLVLEGSIALKRGEAARASDALRDALRREPRNWYAAFQLGVLAASRGDFATASRRLLEVRRLNPRDPIPALVERLVRRRVRIDPERVDELYLDQLELLFDRPVFERHRVRSSAEPSERAGSD
ncbi:MAG: O-antigen ligase family protein [Pseudomonadota bacterium]